MFYFTCDRSFSDAEVGRQLRRCTDVHSSVGEYGDFEEDALRNTWSQWCVLSGGFRFRRSSMLQPCCVLQFWPIEDAETRWPVAEAARWHAAVSSNWSLPDKDDALACESLCSLWRCSCNILHCDVSKQFQTLQIAQSSQLLINACISAFKVSLVDNRQTYNPLVLCCRLHKGAITSKIKHAIKLAIKL